MPENPEGVVVSMEEFKKVRLVVGRVVEVRDHPSADRLYVLKVDLGAGKVRQVVAGLKGRIPLDEIKDRLVVVVENLKPAVLRGERSEGMILAAIDGDKLALVTTHKDVAPGSGIA